MKYSLVKFDGILYHRAEQINCNTCYKSIKLGEDCYLATDHHYYCCIHCTQIADGTYTGEGG